ncbi:MAG: DEAD/DEAH box helicase [Methanospirillum sp.]|uniref:DEAD/DEAH box helicase n=1 Tax=Methanospirillum sp. TaxID=45200 RepID=UPI002371713A|nr:DEAD/DEAH box helicase [Methanospirillum sp.]MDD1729400.1 DEAD/DEAH box helicase [Methanospirillum sp.]
MEYINHPFIAQNSLEKRTYQFSIAMRALDSNTLVVIPTGLGKTAVALIVAASRLYSTGGKVLMLAPTKPLVEQHLRYFQSLLTIPDAGEGTCVIFTGEAAPAVRTAEWDAATVILATPQVVKNDLIAGRYSLRDVSLLVVDEAHRAVGNYAYVFLIQRYMETATQPLVLAMTASPGGNQEKVAGIVENLHITHVETRSELDPDVKPYVHEKEVEIIHVNLPDELKTCLTSLYGLIEDRLSQLKEMGFPAPDRKSLSMKALQELNALIQQRISERDATGFAAASIHAECMKLRHAVGLAESQGCLVLKGYLQKLAAEGQAAGGSKASKRIAEDPRFTELLSRAEGWQEECHPKLLTLPSLVEQVLDEQPESRVIVFATYRDTVRMIVEMLAAKGITAERFVGQATKDREKGLSQKKQIAALKRFREGEFRVLVATSVGEEGLDIPSTDVVIFYEPVPSEIRSIQRKGRTGRHGTGRIIVMVTRGTSDEISRFTSVRKERAMAKQMSGLGKRMKGEIQSALSISPTEAARDRAEQEEYFGPEVVVDDRELVSKVSECLSAAGARIRLERLTMGDYRIGDRILVERKTTRDFVDTLIERDLLGQIRQMAANCIKPVLIIEGSDLYSQRDIHPNAIRGALAAIGINFGVTLFTTSGPQETAELLMVLARRESEEGTLERGPQTRTYQGNHEAQEAIITAFQDIGLKHARSLLDAFGSVQAVIQADRDELLKVPGIGAKKAERIYELSRLPYP